MQYWMNQLEASTGRCGFILGSLVKQGHCRCSKVGGGAAGWAPCSSGATRWPVWPGRAAGSALLARLYIHMWLGKVSGYVPWQGSATGWTLQLGRAVSWTPQLLLAGWGLRLCYLSAWCCWLDSVFMQGHKQGSMIRRGLRPCSVNRWGQRLWPKVGQCYSCPVMSYQLLSSVVRQSHLPGSLCI